MIENEFINIRNEVIINKADFLSATYIPAGVLPNPCCRIYWLCNGKTYSKEILVTSDEKAKDLVKEVFSNFKEK